MTRVASFLLIAGLTAALAAQSQPPVTAELLFKTAQQKERIDRDLSGALTGYEALVDQFPRHALAANALLQIGLIHDTEKRPAQARAAFERLLRDFPSSVPAAEARRRVQRQAARFRETELVPTGRADSMLLTGRVSPDGRYISFSDVFVSASGGTGNLALWDTRSDSVTVVNRVSNQKPWADGYAEDSCWSPDGTELAYAWYPKGSGGKPELRIVTRRTGRHRTVYAAPRPGRISPLHWFDAGRLVVSLADRAGEGTVGASQLAVLAPSTGRMETLVRMDGSAPGGAMFSPDGNYIAYDIQPDGTQPSRDIALVPVRGGPARTVVGGPSNETLLAWLPSGELLYTSDRDGSTDAWVIAMKGAEVAGPATVVRRDVGQVRPQGVTRDGRVFVSRIGEYREIFVADLDPVTGRAAGPPLPLARAQTSIMRSEPAYSRDGKNIAYVQSGPGAPQSIVLHDLATNETRTFPVPVRNIDWPLWHPNNRAFIFDGTGEDNVQRTFKLDFETGRTETFYTDVVFGVSPDATWIYVRDREFGGSLTRRNLLDGRAFVVSPADDLAIGSALSPDGRWIADLVRGGGRGGNQARGRAIIRVRPAEGGSARILAENVAAGYPRLAWSPDSHYVIFNNNPDGLHRVAVDGGPAVKLGIAGGGGFGVIQEKSMHPDGRRFAFGVRRNRFEVWIWENVIPTGRRQ